MNTRLLFLLACMLCMATASAEGGADPAVNITDNQTATDPNAAATLPSAGNDSQVQAEANASEKVAAEASPQEAEGSGQDGMDASAIKSKVLAASANITSYQMAMEMDFEMALTPLGEEGADLEILQGRGLAMAAMNITNRSMKMVMATMISPMGQWDQAAAMATDTYFVNDTMYTREEGEWSSTKLDDPDAMWGGQDMLGQGTDDLNLSEVTLLGEDVVDGQDCYLLSVQPNLTETSNMTDELITNVTEMTGNTTLNLTAIMSGMNISYLQWVSKETFQPVKTEIIFTISLTPDILGLEKENESENASVAIQMDMTVKMVLYFKGFDQDVTIVLPEEAKAAVPLELITDTAIDVEEAGSDQNVTEEADQNQTKKEGVQGDVAPANQSKEEQSPPAATA